MDVPHKNSSALKRDKSAMRANNECIYSNSICVCEVVLKESEICKAVWSLFTVNAHYHYYSSRIEIDVHIVHTNGSCSLTALIIKSDNRICQLEPVYHILHVNLLNVL